LIQNVSFRGNIYFCIGFFQALGMQFKNFFFESVDSTNVWLSNLAQSGNDIDGLVVVAGYQTKGRGINTNSWHSDPGKNLLFSIGYRPKSISPSEQFIISKAVSLALVDVLKFYVLPEDLHIKWPNDIYVRNNKIAGILISSTVSGNKLESSIIGIGINVNQTVFPGWIKNPTSVFRETFRIFDCQMILNEFLDAFSNRFDTLNDRNKFDQLHKAYFSLLYRRGEWAAYMILGEKKRAKIKGLSEYGQLILVQENGEKVTCDLKEIVFLEQ